MVTPYRFYCFSHDLNPYEKTQTKTGLSVAVNILNKVYKTGRKVADNFKNTMQIVFDEYLPKWNYRAVPQPE